MEHEVNAEPPASADVDAPTPADAGTMLLEFVRDRDTECPRCGYNLRGLTTPMCPECEEHLELRVGAPHWTVKWLLIAAAPGFFAGIGGLFLTWAIVFRGPAPTRAHLIMWFCLTSGLVTLLLTRYNRWFMRQPDAFQAGWAVTTWAIHILMFLMLVPIF